MAVLPARIEAYLRTHYVMYQVTCHVKTPTLEQAAEVLGVPGDAVARGILLKDVKGLVMVVLPLTRLLHLTHLREKLNRQLEVISGPQADAYFADCEPGSRPPLGEAYGIATIIDNCLLKQSDIYFEPGNRRVLVKISQKEFALLTTSLTKMDISVPHTFANYASKTARTQRQENFNNESQRLCQHLTQLPHFPEKPKHLALLLASLEEKETSEAIESAFEPFFRLLTRHSLSCAQKKECVQAVKILLTLFNALPIATDGPLGQNQLIRQSFYLAFLAAGMAAENRFPSVTPAAAMLSAGSLYCGIFLLGFIFPPEFRLLNRLSLAYPTAPVAILEQRLLGMGRAHDVLALGHAQVGAWLLKHWSFPPEVALAVAKQSHINYKGVAKEMVTLVQIASQVLTQSGFCGLPRGHMEFDEKNKEVMAAKNILSQLLLHTRLLDKLMVRWMKQPAVKMIDDPVLHSL